MHKVGRWRPWFLALAWLGLALGCGFVKPQAQAPPQPIVVAEDDSASLTNPDAGLNPNAPLNYNADRIQDVAVPGLANPSAALGVPGAPPSAPIANVPAPAGFGNGLGSGAGTGVAGGMAGVINSFAGRSGATRVKMLEQAGDGSGGIPFDGEGPGHNTEAYDRIDENPFHAAERRPVHLLDRRRHRLVRQRPPLSPAASAAAAAGRRAHRGDGQLLPLRLRRRRRTTAVRRSMSKSPTARGSRTIAWCASASRGKEIPPDERPASNLVFLLDVSGSMETRDKLPLVKRGLKLLVEQLRDHDRVAIVVYAGSVRPGAALDARATNRSDDPRRARQLQAGGSTNGGAGIELAYEVAQENFIKGGINRVILCTDGDFNVGITEQGRPDPADRGEGARAACS